MAATDWDRVRDELTDEARALGFEMSSMPETGALLASLVASRPGGRVLELGTGLGFGTTWLLQSLPSDGELVTVEFDGDLASRAEARFASEGRVHVVAGDAGAYLTDAASAGEQFDLVFADAWPGKFSHREEALRLVRPGGFYVVDDLLPQPAWPEGHQGAVDAFMQELAADERFAWAYLEWASGVLIGTRLVG